MPKYTVEKLRLRESSNFTRCAPLGLIAAGLFVLGLAACAPEGQETPERFVAAIRSDGTPTLDPQPAATVSADGEAAEAPVSTEATVDSLVEAITSDPAESGANSVQQECPPSLPGAFAHAEERFCLRVPDGHTVRSPMPGRIVISGPAPDDGGPAAQLVITEEGGATGRDSLAFAEERTAAIAAAGITLQRASVVIGGSGAITVEPVPGIAPARMAFLVHDDRAYVLTVLPLDPARPEVTAAAEALWAATVESFTFR